ncbi:MAG: T9SS type A sorting domain-containing protein [Flavobacteriales bacterium]|nr:T9SS type A sorting domain-containing protein [Flavobacteriales bacterium]
MKRRMSTTRVVLAALAVLLLCGLVDLKAQGLNNLWLGGYFGEDAPPWGSVDIDFQSDSAVITTTNRAIGFGRTSANITDASGNLLFSTNGAFIANATGDTMLNGTGLNPSTYTSNYPGGLHISQGCLILPKPDTQGIYHLFHGTVDDQTGPHALYLYLTTIDMSLDGGLGGVVTKNQVLISDSLNVGKVTAVRHANGRDWWVFCHKVSTNMFYRLLLTPQGISMDGTQSIGVTRPPDVGQVCFSPDGSRFAYYWGQFNQDLEIFDFDRCTGLFSNPVHILISDANSMGGVAFSPNSRFLYISSVEDVYQYDTEAPDIEASMVHIAHWDGFYSPFPPLATLFDITQLAPNGKIYIGTGNSTFHLHVINAPDEGGMACDMVQHGLELPRYFINSLPNHPNYHLGPVDGSICDSLGINAGVPAALLEAGIKVYPNPSNGAFTVSYPAQPHVGELEVRDLSGRLVLRERIPQWSQVRAVQLKEAVGMYQCRLTWGTASLTTRIILAEP